MMGSDMLDSVSKPVKCMVRTTGRSTMVLNMPIVAVQHVTTSSQSCAHARMKHCCFRKRHAPKNVDMCIEPSSGTSLRMSVVYTPYLHPQ
jgi:hypothetical protein